jgi:hypothetical protein
MRRNVTQGTVCHRGSRCQIITVVRGARGFRSVSIGLKGTPCHFHVSGVRGNCIDNVPEVFIFHVIIRATKAYCASLG